MSPDTLQIYGSWAFNVLLIGAVGILWRELLQSHKREVQMAEKILPLISEMKGLLQHLK